MEIYEVIQCPTTELSLLNKAIVNTEDKLAQSPDVQHIAVRYPKKKEAFVFSVGSSPTVRKGQMAFNLSGRKWASLMAGARIEVAAYRFVAEQCLTSITFFIDFASKQHSPAQDDFETEDMAKQFSQQFFNQAFTVGQVFGFSYLRGNKRVVFELVVKDIEAMKLQEGTSDTNLEIGLLTANTIILFERAEKSEVRLVGGLTGKVAAPQLFNQNWDFGAMGVGGLSEQFNKIFRRAFATRLLPPEYVRKVEAEHVRGILLYGPPGTGKTLIARQIGKMLLAREPKIVNGPEVLNKYVGESEANIRKLFQEAEEEQAKAGIYSGLHMIIFDEIDAICKARGNSASSAGVGDNVVNQLLSKIDGVNALHNVLLVGMTNRRDLIDEALLRPGRLEVQIEIGLPNRQGRLEIFRIHTKAMIREGVIDESVKLEELADVTKNYTGAEIAGLIKAARSLAINRVLKPDSKELIDEEKLKAIKITRKDFQYAMDHDVKPALGASEDQLKSLALPIIQWDHEIATIQSHMNRIVEQVAKKETEKKPYFVLLLGGHGSGLTTLAANMAAETHFPFIRVYEARATASKTESAKVQYMDKLFVDAARSELSCIVVDDIEEILEYHPIGPRFSNTSRAVFKANRNLQLPDDHRMLVICTCSNEQFLNDLQLRKIFRRTFKVPLLSKPEQVDTVLSHLYEAGDSTFQPGQRINLINNLSRIPFRMGIKELERLINDVSKFDPDERVQLFKEIMEQEDLILKPSKLSEAFY